MILMGAMLSVLRISQSSHNTAQQGLELQQNVRAALDFVCRELINAGNGIPYLTPLNGSPAISVPVGAKLGPLGAAVSSGSVFFVTPCPGAGETVTKDGEGKDLATSIQTDMLVFLGGVGEASFVNQNSPGPSAGYGATVYVENQVFTVGQVVLITNGFQVAIGQITQTYSNGGLKFGVGQDSLSLNPGATQENPNPNQTAAQQVLGGPPPQVYPLATVTYFIDATTNPVHPSFKRWANTTAGAASGVTVADDIESLQVTFLIDHDANATTAATPIWAPDASQLSLIRGATISITGRSRGKTGDKNYSDGHSRLMMSQTVFFRNNIRR